jgi:predicted kinase
VNAASVPASWAWTCSLAEVIPAEGPALIALLGPPAAGKSSQAAALAGLANPPAVVSLDECRAACSPYGDESDQAVTPQAVTRLLELIDGHLALGGRVVVDATSATIGARAALLEAARTYGAPAIAAVVLPDVHGALERNAQRNAARGLSGFSRQVPAEFVRRAHASLTRDLPTLASEGWTPVWRIDHDSVQQTARQRGLLR